jgi:hypothetical protein
MGVIAPFSSANTLSHDLGKSLQILDGNVNKITYKKLFMKVNISFSVTNT